MLACPAVLLLLHADHLLITTPAPATHLQTASLEPDEAQPPSHQLLQVCPLGLLRSRADTRTQQISIHLASGPRLAVLRREFLRRKVSQQLRHLASPCLLQERQAHPQRRLDSCPLRAFNLHQALAAGEANHSFVILHSSI